MRAIFTRPLRVKRTAIHLQFFWIFFSVFVTLIVRTATGLKIVYILKDSAIRRLYLSAM